MRTGAKVTFTPTKGKTRTGTLRGVNRQRGTALVHLEGDPFPVTVEIKQLQSCIDDGNNVRSHRKAPNRVITNPQGESKSMTTTRRPDAKALRKQAQALGIQGWEDMGRAELAQAVKDAEGAESAPARSKAATSTRKRRTSTTTAKKAPATKKTATKRAPARKAAATKAPAAKKEPKSSEPTYSEPPKGVGAPDEAVNPFRKGSNLHTIYPILVPRGGKRRVLAERLQKKVDLHPYSGDDSQVDLSDYDKRIMLCAQTLRDNFGYAIERQGRGLEGTVRVFVPGSADDPRASSNGKAKPRRK